MKRATKHMEFFELGATFQSAPASCEAGDEDRRAYLGSLQRFNPRPLRVKRATACRNIGGDKRRFQSAPASCEAGDTELAGCDSDKTVSIRARFV